MATLTIPTKPAFIAARWSIQANTQVHQSPLTRTLDTRRLTGERWSVVFRYPQMKDRATAAEWEVFLTELEGRAGRFFAPVPFRTRPQLNVGGTPLVNGADQSGSNINTNGWPNDITVLKKGDYIQFTNDELKILTADAISNGSGESTLQFKPNLRNSPADASAITLNDTGVVMMLLNDEQGWDYTKFGTVQFSLAGVEAF